MSGVLELITVTKRFRGNWTWRAVTAVEDLSLGLQPGEIFGLIGHNGAGKTTTFKLLVGLLRPTHGVLIWNGSRWPWDRPRPDIGFSPEQPYFYDHLTVRETLHLYGQLYGMGSTARRDRIGELARDFAIAHKLDAPMRTLSKGTLQRVAVAQAIMHRPALAILDEPMSGLDPAGRKDMRDLIAALRRDGTTVLFSSHILSDAEALCDRVGILAQAQLREVVTISTHNGQPSSYKLILSGAPEHVVQALSRIAVQPPAGGPERGVFSLPDQGAVQAALACLAGTAACVEALLPQYPSLEQRFLRYMSNGLQSE